MNITFNEFINENLTHAELIEDLKDAKFIQVEFIGGDKRWGVSYLKGGKKHEEGMFNNVFDVHNFLIENDIQYDGRNGFEYMKQHRKSMQNLPFQGYQRALMDNGIEDML